MIGSIPAHSVSMSYAPNSKTSDLRMDGDPAFLAFTLKDLARALSPDLLQESVILVVHNEEGTDLSGKEGLLDGQARVFLVVRVVNKKAPPACRFAIAEMLMTKQSGASLLAWDTP